MGAAWAFRVGIVALGAAMAAAFIPTGPGRTTARHAGWSIVDIGDRRVGTSVDVATPIVGRDVVGATNHLTANAVPGSPAGLAAVQRIDDVRQALG